MSQKTPEQRERAYELLDFLKNHPEHHDQNHWVLPAPGERVTPMQPMTASRALARCGTTACAAGWTVLLAGGQMVEQQPGATFVEGLDGMDGFMVPGAASVLLGLSGEEAEVLFYWAESLEDVAAGIERIFGPDERGR